MFYKVNLSGFSLQRQMAVFILEDVEVVQMTSTLLVKVMYYKLRTTLPADGLTPKLCLAR